MATLDDSPSRYSGQPWSVWAENVPLVDNVDPDEVKKDDGKKNENESMKLRKEDMALFGLCPAQDELYFVICEQCSQVIKPQALKRHCEVRHGETVFVSSKEPRPSVPPAFYPKHVSNCLRVPTKASVKQRPPSLIHAADTQKSPSFNSRVNALSNKEKNHAMPVVKVERMPESLPPVKKPCPASQDATKPAITNGTLKNAIVSPSVSAIAHAAPGPTALSGAVLAEMAVGALPPKKEKLLPCKDREFDANKHCGVIIQDIGKPCTRSLTCKTHALSLRRAVVGRRKPFDELLKEHRAVKEAMQREKAAHAEAVAAQRAAAAAAGCLHHHGSNSTSCAGVVTSHSSSAVKHSLSSLVESSSAAANKDSSSAHHTRPMFSPASPHKIKYPKPPTNSFIERQGHPTLKPVAAAPQIKEESPGITQECYTRLSSDGEDGDESHSKSQYAYLTHHPRPAAVCTFGARYLKSGFCVFNRKTDYLHAALLNVLEKHTHPPPHKKLCVESNLPKEAQIVTNSKDPYEFNMVDTTSGNTHNLNSVLNSANKGALKSKSKSSASKTSKPKDSGGAKSPGLLTSMAGNNAVKRKRSSGSMNASQSPVAVSPVCSSFSNSTLPIYSHPLTTFTYPNVNLSSSTLSHFNATLPTGKQPCDATQLAKQNINLKDMGIVVTSTLVNGQYMNIAGVTDTLMTQVPAVDDRCSNVKRSHSSSIKNCGNKAQNILDSSHSVSNSGLFAAAVQRNAMLVDGSMQPVLASVSLGTATSNAIVSIGNSAQSPKQPSPSTTPTPLFRSGSVSPQVTASSPLPNGIVPSPSDKSSSNHRHNLQSTAQAHRSHKSVQLSSVASTKAVSTPTTSFPQGCTSQFLSSTQLGHMHIKSGSNAITKTVGNKLSVQPPLQVTFPLHHHQFMGQPAVFLQTNDLQRQDLSVQPQGHGSSSSMIS